MNKMLVIDGIRLNIAFSYSSHGISSEIYYECLSPITGKSKMHMHYMENKTFYVCCRPHIWYTGNLARIMTKQVHKNIISCY